MFDAQLLLTDSSGSYAVLSPWFPRQGDNGTFTIETVKQVGSPTLTVKVVTKNSETAGSPTALTSPSLSASGSAGGQDEATWTDSLLELVRYEFTIEGDAGDWILFRMLPPIWFDDVKG